MLDEWGNAEQAELRRVRNFMVDFGLNSDGELELHEFGDHVLDDIWERAYPVLFQARLEARTDGAGEPTESGKAKIREAVRAERERLNGKRKPKLADTETGKSLQRQTDAPAALVNRLVKRVAAEVLKKTPETGRKQ